MVAENFDIHVYTSENEVDNEINYLRELIFAGADYLHLRKPGRNFDYYAEVIEGIPEAFRKKIVLHSFPELAERYGVGLRLKAGDSLPGVRPATISRSCHSLNEIEKFSESDFVTLSPIFDSISKKGYQSAFEPETLDLRRFKTPVIALGGVTLDKISYLKENGFSGAGFLGTVWESEANYLKFLKFLRMRNFKLQFITDGKDIQSTITQAQFALDGGCRWIQVRMKNADIGEIRETLQELLPKCNEFNATLLVDDYIELACYCHGVHLGQDDMPVCEARKFTESDKIIGLTVNNKKQIEDSISSLPDYYGIGPYRYTTTKKNLAPVLGIDGYKKLLPYIKIPFVAIGGISLSDVNGLLEVGASGVAVSSVITRSDNPVEMTKKFINETNIIKE